MAAGPPLWVPPLVVAEAPAAEGLLLLLRLQLVRELRVPNEGLLLVGEYHAGGAGGASALHPSMRHLDERLLKLQLRVAHGQLPMVKKIHVGRAGSVAVDMWAPLRLCCAH